jgi:hypothetical protein
VGAYGDGDNRNRQQDAELSEGHRGDPVRPRPADKFDRRNISSWFFSGENITADGAGPVITTFISRLLPS